MLIGNHTFQVAGQFLPQYEIYWKRLDPGDSGKVAPMDAAKFLKFSGLSDQTLGKVRVMNFKTFLILYHKV